MVALRVFIRFVPWTRQVGRHSVASMSRPNSSSAIVELLINVAAPTIVLVFLSTEDWLGPVWGLAVALAFPLCFSLYTAVRARRVSPIAIIVIGSVLLTGGIGLFELDVRWFAWKEAAVPLIMGVFVLVSTRTPWPAIPTLLDPLLDADKVKARLDEEGTAQAHESALVWATLWIGLVLVLSAVGTFAFARVMVTSATGTEAFTSELGSYTGWSLAAVGIPTLIGMGVVLRGLLIGIEDRTGVDVDALLR
ncbi:MAG: hypothetical protein ACJAZO_002436 [Myxococcota bacterium]